MNRKSALRSGRFLDPFTAEVVEGDLLIEHGIITEIGTVPASADYEADLDGATVIPGLIDAHFHAYGHAIGGLELETRTLSFVAINGTRRLEAALRRGFTTVRDVAGGDLGISQAIDSGLVRGPRYLFSGPALSQTGGHGDPRAAEYDLCFQHGHMNEIVDGADNIRRAVRSRFRNGAHAIKIMASGGVISPTDPLRIPQYSPDEIQAATEEATRRGSYVAAHAYTADAVIHAVNNGVRSVEHGNLIDADAAALMAAHEAFLVPTLAAYDAMNRRGDSVGLSPTGKAKNSEVLEAGRHAIRIATNAGVSVGFGSDLMGDLENDQLRGIKIQSEAQAPLELLRSLTSVNAQLIQQPDLGALRPGTPADLLILSADPLDDVSVLWDETRPRSIIKAGMLIS